MSVIRSSFPGSFEFGLTINYYYCYCYHILLAIPLTVPPYQSNEVSVLDVTTLLIDRDIRLSWSNDFSTDATPNLLTFASDVFLHTLPVDEEGSELIASTIRSGLASSPELVSHESDIGTFVKGNKVVPGAFEVVTMVTGLSTGATFSFSRWSGVYLISSPVQSSSDFRMDLGSLCNVANLGGIAQVSGGTIPVFACPITAFRARRFNSGFDEEKVVSVNEQMYREQYYNYLHPSSSVCFVQHQSQEPR